MCTHTHTHTQDYAEVLERQLAGDSVGNTADAVVIGRNISPNELDMMNEQQLGQLLELRTETSKPRTETENGTT